MNDARPFEVTIESRPAGAVASIRGEAGNERSDTVRDALARLIDQRVDRVVIDLRDLHYIASMTIAELIHFREAVRGYGGRLRLAGANDNITRLFETSHLSDLFPMFDDPDDALNADA